VRKNIETAPTEKTQTEGERNGSKMTLTGGDLGNVGLIAIAIARGAMDGTCAHDACIARQGEPHATPYIPPDITVTSLVGKRG
jgi:hypothetical protein